MHEVFRTSPLFHDINILTKTNLLFSCSYFLNLIRKTTTVYNIHTYRATSQVIRESTCVTWYFSLYFCLFVFNSNLKVTCLIKNKNIKKKWEYLWKKHMLMGCLILLLYLLLVYKTSFCLLWYCPHKCHFSLWSHRQRWQTVTLYCLPSGTNITPPTALYSLCLLSSCIFSYGVMAKSYRIYSG